MGAQNEVLNLEDLKADAKEMRKPGEVLRRGMSDVHKAFADYMLMNPGCRLREMAAHFGYSVAWISTVINSDMFKAYFETRRQGIDVAIANDLPSRLAAAAHLATERMIDTLETTSDPEILIDAFDKVLHRYGYAPNAKGGAQQASVINNTQNVFYLNKDDLAAARQQLLEAHKPKELEIKGETIGVPVPAA